MLTSKQIERLLIALESIAEYYKKNFELAEKVSKKSLELVDATQKKMKEMEEDYV